MQKEIIAKKNPKKNLAPPPPEIVAAAAIAPVAAAAAASRRRTARRIRRPRPRATTAILYADPPVETAVAISATLQIRRPRSSSPPHPPPPPHEVDPAADLLRRPDMPPPSLSLRCRRIRHRHRSSPSGLLDPPTSLRVAGADPRGRAAARSGHRALRCQIHASPLLLRPSSPPPPPTPLHTALGVSVALAVEVTRRERERED